MNNIKINKQKIGTIAFFSILGLTHIAIILAIILSFRYYSIYPSLFGSIVGIIICLLIIIDIVFFVGFNHKDLALKLISLILALFLLAGGTVGTYYLAKVNGIVDSVLDQNQSKYENFSGVFVAYNKRNSFSSLEDLASKRVGLLTESSNGISYIAKGLLSDAKIDYVTIEYKTNAEMVQALIDGDIDTMAITSAYRNIYSIERDENSPFAKYLDEFTDFYSFEKELKIDNDRKAKNLNTDPFNVLLIGYSRTDIGSTIGLADSIIVATINPQTYTVSMMSIARDSFVPIACYGGEYDKINSGRSTSRACFIETVEDFIGMDIDYYMELDYLGLVQIVNTIGGVRINNPVDFELDGTFVPAGEEVFADGIMALQFCRERHHMPGGDFDRQQHQKEVIIQIAKKFIESGDINLALKAMEAASDWMSTDLTLNQLTTVFNLLLNTKNYTSLDTFDLVDFQTLRITGNGGLKYYSYSMHLPLWVYLIYQGSYDESIKHMKEVLGQYDTIKQEKNFEFSCAQPYIRPAFYSLEYEEKYMFTPDPMPAYWPDLEGLTLAEAMAWASENKINLSVAETISSTDPRYNPEYEGKIYEQSVRYGSLISEYSSGTVTVMGNADVDESLLVPNMKGWSVSKAKQWAYDNDVKWGTKDGASGVVTDQTCKAGTMISACSLLSVDYEESVTISVDVTPSNGGSVSGDGNVVKNSTVNLTATPASGYKFVEWLDSDGGSLGTSTTLSVKATDDLSFKAVFAFDISKLSVGDEVDPDASYVDSSSETVDDEEIYEEESYYTACIITDIDTANNKVKCSMTYHKGTKVDYPYTEDCDPTEACTGYPDKSGKSGTYSCTREYTAKDTYTCACTFIPDKEEDPSLES